MVRLETKCHKMQITCRVTDCRKRPHIVMFQTFRLRSFLGNHAHQIMHFHLLLLSACGFHAFHAAPCILPLKQNPPLKRVSEACFQMRHDLIRQLCLFVWSSTNWAEIVKRIHCKTPALLYQNWMSIPIYRPDILALINVEFECGTQLSSCIWEIKHHKTNMSRRLKKKRNKYWIRTPEMGFKALVLPKSMIVLWPSLPRELVKIVVSLSVNNGYRTTLFEKGSCF